MSLFSTPQKSKKRSRGGEESKETKDAAKIVALSGSRTVTGVQSRALLRLARQVNSLSKARKQSINHVDTIYNSITGAATWQFFPLSNTTQGTGSQERLGLKQFNRNLQMHMRIVGVTGAAASVNTRIVIATIKKGISGGSPSYAEFFTTNDHRTFYSKLSAGDFKIHKDFNVRVSTNPADYYGSKYIKMSVPIMQAQDYLSGASTTYDSGSLWIGICVDQTPNPPVLNWQTRLSFNP